MQCAQCQHENRDGLKFCNQCGIPLSGCCAQCGLRNESGSKFCGECGASLAVQVSGPSSAQSTPQKTESETRFHTLLPAIILWLQREKRVTYPTLTYTFDLDEALVEEIREELIFRQLVIDEDSKGIVWIGDAQMSRSQ